jgi:type II secretory pathway pseudopilin PulG
MKTRHKKITQSGFAVVEAIFTVIIVAIVIGGGVYLFQQKQDNGNKQSTVQTD